jgi:hypothetical protein
MAGRVCRNISGIVAKYKSVSCVKTCCALPQGNVISGELNVKGLNSNFIVLSGPKSRNLKQFMK